MEITPGGEQCLGGSLPGVFQTSVAKSPHFVCFGPGSMILDPPLLPCCNNPVEIQWIKVCSTMESGLTPALPAEADEGGR